ncbi:DUF4097 family beta strand repeat-containing protein [Treponema pedis]|uniref:DUF4097 family beta strand repeat-containing protein n=1 Tax=Treponema pedis TaxID=409322 RepID=UPI0003F77C78|nr:DUF4097 family beta strand repeat-containing protein [Treponema pedis]
MNKFKAIHQKIRRQKTVILFICLIISAALIPVFPLYSDEDKNDIYRFDKSYIEELKSGKHSANIITGEIPASVTHIKIDAFFAAVTVKSESGKPSVTYTIKGLPDKAVKIEQYFSSFKLTERRPERNEKRLYDTETSIKPIYIEVIVPENLHGTDMDISSSYAHTDISNILCKSIELDSGAGGLTVNNIQCKDFSADTGSGKNVFSNLKCKTGEFDTGSGSCTLTNCIITERADFDMGSGSVTCSGNGYIKNPDFDMESGSVYFETGAEGNIKIENERGSVYLDLKNSRIDYLDIDTDTGDVQIKNINVNKSTEISGGSGLIEFKNCIFNNTKANLGSGDFSLDGILRGTSGFITGSGSVLLNIKESSENYGVYIEGNYRHNAVRINGKNFGNDFVIGNKNSEHKIYIDKGTGEFNIDFIK